MRRALVGILAACLVAGGRAGGGSALRSVEGSAEEIVERLLAMGGAIGWGEFALERFGPDELVVTVRNSPFALAYGAAEAPVCHLTRGVLERLAERVLGAPAAATETACVATGASLCRSPLVFSPSTIRITFAGMCSPGTSPWSSA